MNRIKELREKAGLKQAFVANELGVTQGNLSAWETERWEPNQTALKKLADLFGVTVDYLLGRDVAPNKNPTDNTVSIIARGGESVEAELSDEQAEMMINFIKSLKEQNKGRNIDKKRE